MDEDITISVANARAHLGALLDRVEAGEALLITRRGRPIARLAPERSARSAPLPSLAAFRAPMHAAEKHDARLVARDKVRCCSIAR